MAELYAAHFDEVLGDFGDSLLAFVDSEIWPMDEFVVDLQFNLNTEQMYD